MAWLYVPGLADSNSESNSLDLTSEPSVSWRGKPMQRRSLLRVWAKGGWIRHLSGMTLPPSTANRGVEKWISSLADTRANLSALRGSDKDATILATSGRISPESSEKSSPYRCSWKTSEDISSSASERSLPTFEQWATTLRRVCLLRRKLARRTRGSDCSSWPTTKGTDWKDGRRGNDLRHGKQLPEEAKQWQTPAKDQFEKRPTNSLLGRQAPRSEIGGQESSDADPNSRLPLWQTPRTGAHGVPGADATHGGQPKGKRLNPLFVEWLMGWPLGWTDFVPVGTELFRSWQRRHTELLQQLSIKEKA